MRMALPSCLPLAPHSDARLCTSMDGHKLFTGHLYTTKSQGNINQGDVF